MVSSCSAYGCTHRHKKGSEVGMYRFPKSGIRRQAWIYAMKRKDWTPGHGSRVCGHHFQSGKPSHCPHHPDYVPNVFVFNVSQKDTLRLYEKRITTIAKREKRIEDLTAAKTLLSLHNVIPGKQVLRPNLKKNVVPSMNLPVTPTEVKEEMDDDSAQTLKENLPKTPGEKCAIRDCPNYSEEHDADAYAESGVKTHLRSLMCSKHFSEENSATGQKCESNRPVKDEASPSRNVPEHQHYPFTGSDNYQSQNTLKKKSKVDHICKAKLLRRKEEIKRLKQRVKELEAENASLRESETKRAEDLFGHIFTQKQIQLLLSMKQRINFNNEELALLLFGS